MIQHMNTKQKTIFVGMSGGVDSSVSAALLRDAGHDVVGVFIKTWQPDWITCTWRSERRDALRVCAHLDIPFMELDLEEEYKKGVADYMISEYKKGRTPNPDVMCNKEVKFGGFLRWALEHGADAVATGHYAQNIFDTTRNVYTLHQGNDEAKDQSYFLWTLSHDQLQYVYFPVGHLPKDEVRRLAKKYALPTATKKDSQGICFMGQIDMKDFLKHYIHERRGDVLNVHGECIGYHDGALFFTRGERHGFTITQKTSHETPLYVIDKDIDANTITVAETVHQKSTSQSSMILKLSSVVWRGPDEIEGETFKGQIRYHGALHTYTIVSYHPDEHMLVCESSTLDEEPAHGQSLVLYSGAECVGGGIIDAIDYR